MSRTGVEPKPPWSAMPAEVRLAVEDALGSRVARGCRVWGGYTPTPTFRLALADGRRAFLKAVGPTNNQFSRLAHDREDRVYRELAGLISPWAPVCHASIDLGDWKVLLLEDLGPKSAPPWTTALARGVARSLADFHASTAGREIPAFVPRPIRYRHRGFGHWSWVVDEESLRPVADLAGDRRDEAMRWLSMACPLLDHATDALAGPAVVAGPTVLLHGDARSDNLRWRGGRLWLLDWPHVSVGPPEEDIAGFAQSVAVEGGPEPDVVVGWYAERAKVRSDVLDASVAGLAGFFAGQAWQPEVPGLPRLRSFQRRQLAVTLEWASRRLGLPDPTWLNAIAK